MKREYSLSTLEKRLQKLKNSLEREEENVRRVSNNIPWGAGMRRTKCTPSFRKVDEIKAKIQKVEEELNKKRQ